MNLKKNIPNVLTICNLICGCLAVIQCFEGTLVMAAAFVGLALIFDFFDGFVARLLKVSSPIGKDLDSLADMVTFGLVPGIVMFKLIRMSLFDLIVEDPLKGDVSVYQFAQGELTAKACLSYVALLIPIFSCIRLARFNNDTRQSDSFIGLPTPANGMVICSLPLILEFQKDAVLFLMNPYLLCLVSVVMSLLLVAEIPLFALKFKGFSWADPNNRLRFTFLGLAVLLLLIFRFAAIPLVILLYILLSIVNNIFLKKKV